MKPKWRAWFEPLAKPGAKKFDPWLLAAELRTQDMHTPTAVQLASFTIERCAEHAVLREMVAAYVRKASLGLPLYNNLKLPVEQRVRILQSVMENANTCMWVGMQLWCHEDALASAAAAELELLETVDKATSAAACENHITPPEECIICMTEERSKVYRPCGHRVSCDACAAEYWARQHTCPWCRMPCEEP